MARTDLTGRCPDSYLPCSTDTSSENTVCYPDSADLTKVCPITSLKIVTKSPDDISSLSSTSTKIPFDESYDIVFSRTGTDSLPLTTMRLEYAPCMNQMQKSWGPVITKHPAEIQDEGCTDFSLSASESQKTDPRFERVSYLAFDEHSL